MMKKAYNRRPRRVPNEEMPKNPCTARKTVDCQKFDHDGSRGRSREGHHASERGLCPCCASYVIIGDGVGHRGAGDSCKAPAYQRTCLYKYRPIGGVAKNWVQCLKRARNSRSSMVCGRRGRESGNSYTCARLPRRANAAVSCGHEQSRDRSIALSL